MKEIKNLLIVLLAAVFFIGLFVICDGYAEDVKKEYSGQINPSLIGQKNNLDSGSGQLDSVEDLSVEKLVQDMVTEDYFTKVTLSAAGDILCQKSQLEKAYNSESGSFDFSDSFTHVKDIFEASDYAVATLKTTMAGIYKGDSDEFYGYSTANALYNSPEVLAENIKAAGISLVNTANNHSLDSGKEGLFSTIDYLDAAGLAHVGTAKTEDDTRDYSVNIGGIQVGFIGYTNTSNEISLDTDSAYALNLLNDYNKENIETLCTRITAMKQENELVAVMLNFGNVNSDSPETEQTALADQLFKAGADIILGTGSRTLKPLEVVSVTDETTGKTRNCLVLYGMGALLSSEVYSDSEDKDVDISAIFNIGITRSQFGETYLSSINIIPVYSNWYDGKIQPIPVCEAKDTSKYAGELDDEDIARINSAYENTITHLLEGTDLTYTYQDYMYQVIIP